MSVYFHFYLCGRIATEWLIHMKKIVAFIICLALIFSLSAIALAADPKIPLGTVGYINGTGVHFRSSAGIGNNIIGQLKENDKFWYQGYGGEASGYVWYYVYMATGDWAGYSGYVARDYVKWSR